MQVEVGLKQWVYGDSQKHLHRRNRFSRCSLNNLAAWKTTSTEGLRLLKWQIPDSKQLTKAFLAGQDLAALFGYPVLVWVEHSNCQRWMRGEAGRVQKPGPRSTILDFPTHGDGLFYVIFVCRESQPAIQTEYPLIESLCKAARPTSRGTVFSDPVFHVILHAGN